MEADMQPFMETAPSMTWTGTGAAPPPPWLALPVLGKVTLREAVYGKGARYSFINGSIHLRQHHLWKQRRPFRSKIRSRRTEHRLVIKVDRGTPLPVWECLAGHLPRKVAGNGEGRGGRQVVLSLLGSGCSDKATAPEQGGDTQVRILVYLVIYDSG